MSVTNKPLRFTREERKQQVWEIIATGAGGMNTTATRIGSIAGIGPRYATTLLKELVDDGVLCLEEQYHRPGMKKNVYRIAQQELS